jgi:two-component system, LytTR family, sensor kinase
MEYRLAQMQWSKWLLFVVGWTVLSLLFVPETYLFFLYRGEAISWSRTLVLTVANAGIALVFLPPIVWLTRHFPFDRQNWRKAMLVHLPACFVFSLSHSWLYALLCYASPALFHMLFLRFHPNLLTYWGIVGFTQAADYFRRYTERERQLAQAELQLLKSQLQPHFLFNTLNTVSAMMHEDVSEADRMVSRLSDLLRMTLDNLGKHEIPLSQELDFLHRYLDIERIRFPERLTFRLEVDPETYGALVPSMVLQPLVENSIRHGFGVRRTPGVIRLRARVRNRTLLLELSDDGCGLSRGDLPFREGVALTNIRRRLEQLYPGAHVLRLESSAGSGTIVHLEIPLHTVPELDGSGVLELVADENSDAHCR